MKNILSTFIIFTFVITLTACETTSDGSTRVKKQPLVAIAGAAAGAYAGSNIGGGKGRTAAIAAGTILGAYLGSELGKSLDAADKAYMQNTTQTALEKNVDGGVSNWNNPNSQASGSITPTRTFQETSGRYCREYTQKINVGGKEETVIGTACRDAQGTWKVIN